MLTPKEKQLECFEYHIKLAIETGLPMFCHERNAHDDFMKLILKYKDKLDEANVKIVVHCFTGISKKAKKYINNGFYIGLTGFVCNKKRNKDLVEAIEKGFIPLENLMIETNAPYMKPPKAKGGRKNVPVNIKHVIADLGYLYKASNEKIIDMTTKNACEFFNLKYKNKNSKSKFKFTYEDFPVLR